MSIEVGLTPLLYWARAGASWSTVSAGLAIIGVQVIVAALLFAFLAAKLRLVRAREMRAVYFNYAAFVLASYAANLAKPGDPSGGS